jgi:RHH-type proline utilization regulon transcriptional repressor/proline dehydrogenase/delta 1-pyrroline-5-carboxylate dehydrogenase
MTEAIYKITTMNMPNYNNWTIHLYDQYSNYFKENDAKSLKEIVAYCELNPSRKNFKALVEVGSIQFLAGVFPQSKEIKIASKQLSYELMLVSHDEKNTNENYIAIKKYAEEIGAIPVENTPVPIELISSTQGLPLFNEQKFNDIHTKTDELATELIVEVNKYRQSFFEKITDFGLDLTANYMLIRIHLLKFLAILPNLDHDKTGTEVKRMFLETISRLIDDSLIATNKNLKGQKRPLPTVYINICKVLNWSINYCPATVFAFVIRSSVAILAQRFIAGESIYTAKSSLHSLLGSGRDATIDQLGELVVSNKEADEYTAKVLEVINGLEKYTGKGSKNSAGINKAHVSIKVSALCNDFKPQDFEHTYAQVSKRLIDILIAGKNKDVFVNIDAEHYHFRDIIFKVYAKVLTDTPELADYAQTGIVVQAYLRDGINHYYDVVELAKKRKVRMPIRLVKGAYWDAETIEADAHNFIAPQFLNKDETDIHFRQLVFKSLEDGEYIQLAVASHNIQDHCFAETLRAEMFKAAPVIEHQCLHMTYEALSIGLSKMNWPTRNYIPVGNLLVGMAYLVRRIMENSSQVGVLTIMRSHKKALGNKTPTQKLRQKKDQLKIKFDKGLSSTSNDFKNIYPLRTYIHNHFNRIELEVSKLKESLTSNNLIFDQGDQDIVCSSQPELLLGRVKYDTAKDVNTKIDQLFKGYNKNKWKDNHSIDRFAILHKLTDLLLINREELSAIIMLEAGKTIDEAVADVDEAIDFIEFYIREQIKIIKCGHYRARGVVGVIAPWNFPLAIPCGMTVASLVAGNSVILKPAEQTPLIGLKFVELCHQAGVPEDILQVSLGEANVGKAIVSHELVTGVVFTGSKLVGTSIFTEVTSKITSKKYDYKPISKFAITEMGGKNAIIVTNNSELDEAVSGIIYSAFAHAGQKCSAASRIIIDEKLKDAFIARFANAVKDIKVGRADDYSTVINPLITKEDQERVRAMAKTAREEVVRLGGRIIVDDSTKDYPGFCVGPSVFEVSAKIALTKGTIASKEVFGPIVHIIPYSTLDEAVSIFNDTEYALTGGIFCQSQDDINYLVPKLLVGNIYINRPNTGARVAIEPFGGFKMSGTGPKAGGIDYLYQFNRQVKDKEKHTKPIYSIETEVEDYIVRFSKLSEIRRVYNSKKMIKQLINQFEFFFMTIDENDKLRLNELIEFINEGKFNLSEREFPNRYIPGQINFNKRNIPLGIGILLDTGNELTFEVVFDFLVNLLVGNGVSIITSNDESYERWKSIIELAMNCGFSKFNLSLSNLPKEKISTILADYEYHFVLNSNSFFDKEFKDIILKREMKTCLIKIIFPGENETIDQAISRFTHCRAFAINTMRLGAPLELSL